MPGTTDFPAALDTFPDIAANTPENESGKEHDVVHNNEMAAIAALQVKVGIDDSEDPDSLDHRIGVLEGSAVAASIAVRFVADTSSTTDADPGAGQLRRNHATQASVTQLFVDDVSSDGASLTNLWPRYKAGGLVYAQHATDEDVFEIWYVTSVTDATGYAKLGVELAAALGTFANGDPMLVTFDQGPGSAYALASDLAAAGIGEALGVVLSDLNTSVSAEPFFFSFASGATNAPIVSAGIGHQVGSVAASNASQFVVNSNGNPRAFWRSYSGGAWNAWMEVALRNPRTNSTASASSIAPNWATYDIYAFTALAANLTIGAPGAGNEGSDNQLIGLTFTANGTLRTLTWNAVYVGKNLPATVPATGTLSVWFRRNAAAGTYDLQFVSDTAPRTTVNALATSGAVTVDCALGDYFTIAPTGNITSWAFTNLPGTGRAITLMIQITQDTTPRTMAWPSGTTWAGGVAGAISTGSGAKDMLALTSFDNGATWRATLAKAFA